MEANAGNHQGSSDEKKKRKRQKKLQSDIRRQIEFYFSDANLRKDRFLKVEIDKSEDGYIHISTIAAFNRILKMTADQDLIAKALEKSELLEVNEDKTQLRRRKPIEEPKYNIDEVTVYVENLPHNVDHGMLQKAFSSCGAITYISLPRYKATSDPKKFAFIEFSAPDEAARACKLLNNPPRDKPDVDGHFPTTRKGRLILPEQPVCQKQPRQSRQSEKRDKEKSTKRKRDASETEETSPDVETKKTSKKKKGTAKKGDALDDGEDEVMLASKQRREAGGAADSGEEGAQLNKRAKKKKEPSQGAKDIHQPLPRGDDKKDVEKQDGQKDKNLRKRKHTGCEDTAHERSSHSEVRSPKGERSDTSSKGERSGTGAKGKRSGTGAKGERSDTGTKGERSDTGTKGERSDTGTKGDKSAKDKKKTTPKRRREDSNSSIESSKVKDPSDKKDDGSGLKRRRAESEISGQGEDGVKRRKRKSRSRKSKKDEAEMVSLFHLRVIPKKEWLGLREEYLTIQKASRQEVKQALRDHSEETTTREEHRQKTPKAQPEVVDVKLKSTEPEFVPGVVLEISSDKPFASRKDLREQLQEISAVAYIELNDGDTRGFVRLKSAEGAKAVLGRASKISNDSERVELNLLSGQDERQYWEKLRADRVNKLGSTKRKQKKRGVDRILDKSEKVLGSGKTKRSHILFDDDD